MQVFVNIRLARIWQARQFWRVRPSVYSLSRSYLYYFISYMARGTYKYDEKTIIWPLCPLMFTYCWWCLNRLHKTLRDVTAVTPTCEKWYRTLLIIIHREQINLLDFYDASDRNLCFSLGNLGIIFNSASTTVSSGWMSNLAGSEVTHRPTTAEINRCRLVRHQPWENLHKSGLAVLLDKNDPACFPNVLKNNFSKGIDFELSAV